MTEKIFKTKGTSVTILILYGFLACFAITAIVSLSVPGVVFMLLMIAGLRAMEVSGFKNEPNLVTVFEDRIEFQTRNGKTVVALASEEWKVQDWDPDRPASMSLQFRSGDRWIYLSERIIDVKDLLNEIVRIWPDSFEADPYWQPGKKWNRW